MAKQRRPSTSITQDAVGILTPASAAASRPDIRRAHRSAAPAPGAAERRSTYIEAVALYERGLEALQRHDYQQARPPCSNRSCASIPRKRSCTNACGST